ncbi:SIR2 family protein [Catellatospora sp. NPDC049133]|jgi:hypothetical protein|uniref:SIR2 family protein n=1 Tax=Catellatospora sp. NPDC049133 TaxID=3155499 RepID=UPI0033C59482
MSKTVLIGNGFSIAYNRELACPAILGTVLKRFREEGAGSDAGSALYRLATDVDPAATDGLEDLLGPLDVVGGALMHLHELVGLAGRLGPSEVTRGLGMVTDFMAALYQRGVGHVLEVVAERSKQTEGDADATDHEVLRDFLRAVVDASPGRTSIATLNYDGLLFSALPDDVSKSDMAEGYDARYVAVVEGGPLLKGQPLRSYDNQPGQYRILNLHGSLGWLHDRGQLLSFRIRDLESVDYWRAWRSGESTWSPVVVLTNQTSKTRRIGEHPFRLAYNIFEAELVNSTHWLIAGYGFGDDALNEALRRAAAPRAGQQRRTCLVVTYGDWPTAEHLRGVLGGDIELFISRAGIAGVVASEHWAAFAT